MNDMTLEQMKQRLSELKLEKARRAQMRANGTPSPTVMGWASAAAGDPSMLMNTKQLRDQQAFQAAESALQRKFQDEQNELNRQNMLKLQMASKAQANEEKLALAQEQMDKLLIQKTAIEAEGGDSRIIDASINRLLKIYPTLSMEVEGEYDPKQSLNYKLAMNSKLSYKNTQDELSEAMKGLEVNMNSEKAAKEYVRLQEELNKRKKADDYRAKYKEALATYEKTGKVDPILIKAGLKEMPTDDGQFSIVDKDGIGIATISKKGTGKRSAGSGPKDVE